MPSVLYQVSASVAPLRAAPRPDGPQETQMLIGETFEAETEEKGWVFGRASFDGYEGYVDMAALSAPVAPATHRVSALRTYIFSEPDIKSAPLGLISMNAKVAEKARDGRFVEIERGGYVVTDHLANTDAFEKDFVAVAERFLGAPYFWGGRESLGLDCSALVQNALEMCGLAAPRNAGQQEQVLGDLLPDAALDQDLARGDLIFWKGHVGVMTSPDHMVHANATAMQVSIDPVRAFAEKVLAEAGPVTSVRRFPKGALID